MGLRRHFSKVVAKIVLITACKVRRLCVLSPGLEMTDIIQEQCESYNLIKVNRSSAAKETMPSTTDKSNKKGTGKAVLVLCF